MRAHGEFVPGKTTKAEAIALLGTDGEYSYGKERVTGGTLVEAEQISYHEGGSFVFLYFTNGILERARFTGSIKDDSRAR